jgi:hypothetical protein
MGYLVPALFVLLMVGMLLVCLIVGEGNGKP